MTQDGSSAQELLLVRSSHEVAEKLKRLHPETEEQVQKLQTEIDRVGARVVAASSFSRASAALRRLRRLCLKLDLMGASQQRLHKPH